MISGLIGQGGYDLVNDENEADVSVLVTCSVKSVTEERMLSRIRALSRGSQKLVVAGCLAKAAPEKIRRIKPDFSLVGPDNLADIVPAVEATLRGMPLVSLERTKLVKLGLPRTRLNSVTGIVEISSGCLSSCTFCQVKLVKGTVFSYPEHELLDEIKSLVSQGGAKEIWLTSTDNAAYGRDSKSSLSSLIRRVCSLPWDFKVRLGMMNPLLTKRDLDDFIECLKHEKLFKFVHLPVQSGSERILRLMQRGYAVSDFERMVARIRQEIPEVTLSTDVIVGFPTETESEFEESMDLLRRIKPDVLNLSRFGARDGTKAATMDGQIKPEVSKARSTRMSRLAKQIQNDKNASWIGWKGKILLDERVKGAIIGRNYTYKPCLVPDGSGNLGEEIDVSVVGSTASTLRAEIVS